jgi:hypothetical protein
VTVYEDGRWICNPADEDWEMGFGETAADAVENCHHENTRPS